MDIRGRIFVVDDDPFIRDLLCEVVGTLGHDGVPIASGEEALARVRTAPPDAVLLDVVMPGLGGIEALRRMKAEPGMDHVPIVVVTGRGDAATRLEALEAGAEDYVTKPFRVEALRASLERCLQLAALRRRVAEANLDTVEFEDHPRPLLIGDDQDLRRDLLCEMARADRYDRPLACAVLAPQFGPIPDGPDRPAWLAERALMLARGLRESDRIYVLAETLVILLPECDGQGLGPAIDRMRECLGAVAGHFVIGVAVHHRGARDLLGRAREAALSLAAA